MFLILLLKMVYQDTKNNYYYTYQPSVDSFYAYDFSNLRSIMIIIKIIMVILPIMYPLNMIHLFLNPINLQKEGDIRLRNMSPVL